MQAEVTAVIICDDVRKEMSGKDILIGVYSGTLNVPAYPAAMAAAFWIEMEPDGVGTVPCQIRIETPSGNPPFEVGFDMEVKQSGTAVFVMGGVPLNLERDGDIVISAKIGAGDMKPVKRKKVQRAPFSNASMRHQVS